MLVKKTIEKSMIEGYKIKASVDVYGPGDPSPKLPGTTGSPSEKGEEGGDTSTSINIVEIIIIIAAVILLICCFILGFWFYRKYRARARGASGVVRTLLQFEEAYRKSISNKDDMDFRTVRTVSAGTLPDVPGSPPFRSKLMTIDDIDSGHGTQVEMVELNMGRKDHDDDENIYSSSRNIIEEYLSDLKAPESPIGGAGRHTFLPDDDEYYSQPMRSYSGGIPPPISQFEEPFRNSHHHNSTNTESDGQTNSHSHSSGHGSNGTRQSFDVDRDISAPNSVRSRGIDEASGNLFMPIENESMRNHRDGNSTIELGNVSELKEAEYESKESGMAPSTSDR